MTQRLPPAGLAGTVDHVDAGDGWLVVRLMTRQAMDREGAHMGHCLSGHGSYRVLAGEEEMTGDSIWSLRDPAGMSRATLDVRSRRVIMASGKGNSDVGGKAARRLKALVAAFKAAGHDLDFDGETGIVVAPNGYTCREDQAPPEVLEAARARHKAARVARNMGRPAGVRNGLFITIDEVTDDWRRGWRDIQDRLARASERRPAPERDPFCDLLSSTAHLPNPLVEIRREIADHAEGLHITARLRDGQVVEVDEAYDFLISRQDSREALARNLCEALARNVYEQVLRHQPLTGVTHTNLTRGDIVDLPGHHVTDVTVRFAGEDLRDGEDYGVDAPGGLIELKRDVPGSVLITFRPGPEPRREVLVPTFGIPWSVGPILNDRVAIGVDTQGPQYGSGGGVSRRSAADGALLRVDGGGIGSSGGFPGGGGGWGVMISTPSAEDTVIGDLG